MAKKSSKSSKGYFGLSHLVSIILAILPTNIILGIITRAIRGNVLGVILNIIICPLFWIVDLITIILNNRISFLA